MTGVSFDDGLRHEHAIERIAVVNGEAAAVDRVAVFEILPSDDR